MADVSFAHVTAEGFTAFNTQLEKDAWASIGTPNMVHLAPTEKQRSR